MAPLLGRFHINAGVLSPGARAQVSADQTRVREAFERWGIPYDKSVVHEERAKRLGAMCDGVVGRVGSATERLLENAALGMWLISQKSVKRIWLQIFAGKEVHTLEYRKCLSCLYATLWKEISRPMGYRSLCAGAVSEILAGLCLLPFRFTDLRAQLSGQVTASDACLSGGGVTASKGLTLVGRDEAAALLRPAEHEQGVTAVFGFFDGIGGLHCAGDRLGLRVGLRASCETDARCKRLVREAWPGRMGGHRSDQ